MIQMFLLIFMIHLSFLKIIKWLWKLIWIWLIKKKIENCYNIPYSVSENNNIKTITMNSNIDMNNFDLKVKPPVNNNDIVNLQFIRK